MSESTIEQTVARLIRQDVQRIEAYLVPDASGLIKLDAMENPYSWPEPLLRSLQERVLSVAMNRYPDPRAPALTDALYDAFGIDRRWRILLGNGSDELIQLLIEAVAAPGASVMAPVPTFVMYKTIAEFLQVEFHGVDLAADFSLDVEAMCTLIRAHQPALVFLACPNNPTGNLFDRAAIETIIKESHGLVVIDEAYSPFASDQHLDLLARFPNVVVMRTLSKLGLAGLRVGYLVGDPRWISEIDKLRLPYNIGVLTQAVTELALRHFDVFEAQTARIREDRARLAEQLAADPRLRCYPSDANFLVVNVPAGQAAAIHAAMRDQGGVLIKKLDGMHPLLADCLRLTIGTPEENTVMRAALGHALDALQSS